MPKLQFDTSRYCHNNAGRMGKWQGQDVAGLIGDEVKALKEEVAALKEVAKNLRDSQLTLMRVTREHYSPKENMEHDYALATYRAARSEVDRLIAVDEELLAALVGEVER